MKSHKALWQVLPSQRQVACRQVPRSAYSSSFYTCDAAFRLADNLTSAGFAITDATGQLAGHSALVNEPLIAALHVVESIVSAPKRRG